MARYCSEECKLTACCDYCKHAIYDNPRFGPSACAIHNDEEHNEIVEWCSVCDDFYCCLIEER